MFHQLPFSLENYIYNVRKDTKMCNKLQNSGWRVTGMYIYRLMLMSRHQQSGHCHITSGQTF